jgi:hypothetical protein
MKKTIIGMIDRAADETGKSRTALIALLMKRVMKDYGKLARAHQAVRYQGTLPKTSWRRWHITLCSRDYEQFLDMRKFFKLSVSFLVTCAVENHLVDLVEEILNGSRRDNYQYDCYFIVQKSDDCSVSWKVVWGLPENPNELTI